MQMPKNDGRASLEMLMNGGVIYRLTFVVRI